MARASSALGTIRELSDLEQQLHREHLIRLDPEGRRDRFNGIADDTFITHYSARCFAGVTRVFALVDHDGHVRGTGELHPPEGDEPADIAFSVEPQLRRRGIASKLFETVIAAARAEGFDQLRITSSSDNQAMRALARKFGASFAFSYGEAIGTLMVAAPPLAAGHDGKTLRQARAPAFAGW
ncbi:MAG: GNAT family N-acetyltransferase [Rhizobiales bacterium]|nr:GNAT family N-acetyltransferase [Hyphomicrobiales bacterium]